jgi:hypothetical protein
MYLLQFCKPDLLYDGRQQAISQKWPIGRRQIPCIDYLGEMSAVKVKQKILSCA